jgi:hypothetical protein
MRKVDKLNTKDICRKWTPMLEHNFNYKNNFIIEMLSLYAEWYSSDNMNDDLVTNLIEITKKINSYNRLEVLGKYFNPASGIVEYRLSNNEYIPLSGKINNELTIEEMIKIFGIEFIRDLDTQAYQAYQRDKQIDKIL